MRKIFEVHSNCFGAKLILLMSINFYSTFSMINLKNFFKQLFFHCLAPKTQSKSLDIPIMLMVNLISTQIWLSPMQSLLILHRWKLPKKALFTFWAMEKLIIHHKQYQASLTNDGICLTRALHQTYGSMKYGKRKRGGGKLLVFVCNLLYLHKEFPSR